MNYKAITESNLLRIAYPECFPACSSVVYIQYTPSSHAKNPSGICNPDFNIRF